MLSAFEGKATLHWIELDMLEARRVPHHQKKVFALRLENCRAGVIHQDAEQVADLEPVPR